MRQLIAVRAPDHYVYPAPFNLVEVFLVVPFEPFISKNAYIKLNKVVMTVIFFVPLSMIAIYESGVVHARRGLLHDYFADPMPEDDDDPKIMNPEVNDPNGIISKIPFDELVKAFPDTTASTSATILKQLHKVDERLKVLEDRDGGSSK